MAYRLEMRKKLVSRYLFMASLSAVLFILPLIFENNQKISAYGLQSITISLGQTNVSPGQQTLVTVIVNDPINSSPGAVTLNDGNPSAGGTFGSIFCGITKTHLECSGTYTAPNADGSVTITATYAPSGNFTPISDSAILTVGPLTSIPEFPFSFSLVIMFVAVVAVYMSIRQKMLPIFKRF